MHNNGCCSHPENTKLQLTRDTNEWNRGKDDSCRNIVEEGTEKDPTRTKPHKTVKIFHHKK